MTQPDLTGALDKIEKALKESIVAFKANPCSHLPTTEGCEEALALLSAVKEEVPELRDENEGCTCGSPECNTEQRGFNRGWNKAAKLLREIAGGS